MVEAANLARRICSPTSVSMVLDHYGCATTVPAVAAAAYNAEHDMYGVWPANIWAASRWGVLGSVVRFPSWDYVRYVLSEGIPVIASVNYGAGELTGAAISQTPGHLIVLRGLSSSGSRVLVNDPAADTKETVEREYLMSELDAVWLRRKAIGYVLFPAQRAVNN
jgi:hypothetical protein